MPTYEKKPMMKCGHAANAVLTSRGGKQFDPPLPACVICDCYEVDEEAPSLEGREARCTSCGGAHKPSSPDLPFFEYLGPGSKHWSIKKTGPKAFDGYYCGCRGWN